MDTIDTLKIKIEEAKRNIPEESLQAIDSVDWKSAILGMRESRGYSFSQLDSLDIETELLLCGLISPEDYPREIVERMQISEAEAGEIVEEMNEKVFKKIRSELVKIMESKKKKPAQPVEKKPVEVKTEAPNNLESREDLLKSIEKPETIVNPIMEQKMKGHYNIPKKETEHSLPNVTKGGEKTDQKPKTDPYREPIE